ncbi:hypothetical protein V2J09_009189 [Rumex salicifolius]
MAEAILFNMAEQLLCRLGAAAVGEAASQWGFRDQMEQLKNTMGMIKDVLLDAEGRQLESLVLRGWLERLQDVVYLVDDLLDEFATRMEDIAGPRLAMEPRMVLNLASGCFLVKSGLQPGCDSKLALTFLHKKL